MMCPSNVVLFQYIAENNKGGTEEDLDFMLEAYVDGYLGFKQPHKKKETEEKIREILYHNYTSEQMGTADLYDEFLSSPQSLNTEVVNAIKESIYKAVVSELVECAPKIVVENLVAKNSFYIEITDNSWLQEDKQLTSWWYSLGDRNKLENAIKEDPLFKGVVLTKDYDFSSFLCAFQCYETEADYNLKIFINTENHKIEDAIINLGINL